MVNAQLAVGLGILNAQIVTALEQCRHYAQCVVAPVFWPTELLVARAPERDSLPLFVHRVTAPESLTAFSATGAVDVITAMGQAK
jgi:hypothetical protein